MGLLTPPPGDAGFNDLSSRNTGFALFGASFSLLVSKIRFCVQLWVGGNDTASGQLLEDTFEAEKQDFKLHHMGGGFLFFFSPVSWPDLNAARCPDVRMEQRQRALRESC